MPSSRMPPVWKRPMSEASGGVSGSGAICYKGEV